MKLLLKNLSSALVLLLLVPGLSPAAPADGSACPTGMAYIPGPYPYCVDKYEAYLVSGSVSNDACTDGSQAEVDANATTAVAGSAAGQTVLTNINWCAAKKACQNAGKHLLTNSEWFNAANYKGSKWNITAEQSAEAMACNTGGGGVALTGASAGCVTREGVFDMIGNVWEWVDFVVTADPTNGLVSNNITGYDFATGIPTSVGASTPAFGNDFYWAYNGDGVWDEFNIIYENPEGLTIEDAKVYDLGGREIASLKTGAYNSESSLAWTESSRTGIWPGPASISTSSRPETNIIMARPCWRDKAGSLSFGNIYATRKG